MMEMEDEWTYQCRMAREKRELLEKKVSDLHMAMSSIVQNELQKIEFIDDFNFKDERIKTIIRLRQGHIDGKKHTYQYIADITLDMHKDKRKPAGKTICRNHARNLYLKGINIIIEQLAEKKDPRLLDLYNEKQKLKESK